MTQMYNIICYDHCTQMDNHMVSVEAFFFLSFTTTNSVTNVAKKKKKKQLNYNGLFCYTS